MSDLVTRLRQFRANTPVWAAEDRRVLADAADRLELLERELAAKQARIDALMLEFCPDEMTPEQRAEWAAHQVAFERDDTLTVEELALLGTFKTPEALFSHILGTAEEEEAFATMPARLVDECSGHTD